MYGLSLIHAVEPSNPKMVGPPGFEPGSDGPQPPSIGQANPRTRSSERGCSDLNLPRSAEWRNIVNQIHVRNKHSATAVTMDFEIC